MNNEKREKLKSKILKKHKLYVLQYSRLRRLLKDPLRTFFFYILAAVARIKPFKVRAKTLWGDTMTYYIPEGQAILYYGFFEANLTNFFINYLQPGDCFLDVGTHVGYYSVLASRLIGENGSVHGFEPTPRTFASLQENTKKLKNIFINNYAVFNEEKGIEFIDYGPKNSAFNGFKRRTSEDTKFLKNNDKVIKVKTIVLDNYCREKKVNPTFIKIDAEGAENFILEGMKYIMSELRPLISIEVAGEDEWQENCQKSINLLQANNYSPYECTLDGKLKKHTPQEKYLYDNLIFIPREKEKQIIKLYS
jgi:FkbM family methyltransferase